MSGPSATQLNLQQEEADFYAQGMQESQTAFGEDQALLKQMEAVYEPILARGPNQKGFSGAEESDLNAQAIEGTARNYSQAARAVGSQIAAEGGGDNPLPSGGAEALKEEVALSAAGQESQEEQQIVQADYAAGESEFEHAGEALSVASGQLNPTAYENAATSAGSSAETTAKDINAESNSWESAVMGAVGGLGSAVISQNPGGIFD